jgi:hypothetical protein
MQRRSKSTGSGVGMLQLYIDSVNREKDSPSSHNFNVRFDKPINVENFTHFKIQSLQMPVSWYSVPLSNRSFYCNLHDGTGDLYVEVPAGNYTSVQQIILQLMAAQTVEVGAARTLGTVLNAKYNYLTGIMEFRNLTGGSSLTITHKASSMIVLGYNVMASVNRVFPTLVFNSSTQYTETIDGVNAARWGLNSPAVAVIEARAFVDIHSAALSSIKATIDNPSTERNQDSTFIHRFVIPGSTFSQIVQEDDNRSGWIPIAAGANEIQLLDANLRFPINMPVLSMNGANWSFSIKFENLDVNPL